MNDFPQFKAEEREQDQGGARAQRVIAWVLAGMIFVGVVVIFMLTHVSHELKTP